MRLGFNGATTNTSDLVTDIRVSAQAGYEVIELRDDKLERFLERSSLADLRKILNEVGIAPYTINSIDKVGVGGAAGTERAVARCRQLSRYARGLGCPWVLVVPGPTEGRAWDQIRRDTAASLAAMVDAAAEFGVGVAFEFMGFPWSAVRDVTGAWEILQSAGRPGLGMVVDTAHFYSGGSTLESIAQIDVRRLVVLHINDVEDVPKPRITDGHRLYPGDGVIPLYEILGAFKTAGFDGVVSVELFREEYWQQDPLAVARQARIKTQAVWNAATANT